MADTLISPNMTLAVPVPSTCPGPAWAQDIFSCLYGGIDQHNHSAGMGVQIQPSGLNINSNLSFNSNSATDLKTTTYTDQSVSLPNTFLGSVYIAAGNLYFNSGTDGFAVQITSGHSVVGSSGTITGLPSGTASASYSAGTFTFQSATNTAANIDGGSLVIRETVASAKGITISSPTSLAANYGLSLPAGLPGSQSFLSLDTSGNIASYASVSGGLTGSNIAAATITGTNIASATITSTNMAANSIATASIQNAAVTPAKMSATNEQLTDFVSESINNGSIGVVSTTFAASGSRPISVSLLPRAAGTIASLTAQGSGVGPTGYIEVNVGARSYRYSLSQSVTGTWSWPLNITIMTQAAGTSVAISVNLFSANTNSTISISNATLYVLEL